ncbi:MAG TPA: vanadium-dependent haloperoxidase [Chryseosolibacter sp.]
MRRTLNTALSFIIVFAVCCSPRAEEPLLTDQAVATAWADMTLYVTKNTPANSPTYASRALAYIGLTMYESIVHGYPSHASMIRQLNGLDSLPQPTHHSYDWLISLNAGQARILKRLYNQTSDDNKKKIDSLEAYFVQRLAYSRDEQVVSRSAAYGQSVAEAIFEWSKSDGGHRGYLANFDKTFHRDKTPGCWEPPLYGQAISHRPLHPKWGENRNFLLANKELQLPLMIRYNQDKLSDYYKECHAVYEKNRILTQDEKEAALWWGDDPGETFTPPGHSYYVATLVIRKANPALIKCAETYARVGLAVGDAFINCWKWKYHFYSERPSSFITKHIDERWESFWPDPPFPAFPSGHATQAAAVAKVLESLYGPEFEFTDDAHAKRPRDRFRNVDFKPRSFKTFWAVAEETANSRFYGGIHSPQDNRVGLEEGAKIGNNVNRLNWQKEPMYADAKK